MGSDTLITLISDANGKKINSFVEGSSAPSIQGVA